MRSLPVKILAATLGSVVAVVLWLSFAPTKVGGSTTYSVTSGISMEPLLHKGDLAFVRAQSSYHVGDLTLYQSPVVHQPVLHRIIVIQDGKYFFQGDNNNFVDPGYATRDELIGTMWFSIPGAGSILGWFGEPTHAGLIAGLGAMAIVLASITTTRSRRRRRRKGPHTMKPKSPSSPSSPSSSSSSSEPSPAAAPLIADEPPSEARRARADESGPSAKFRRRPPSYFAGPRSSLIALGVTVTLAVLMLGVGFTRPADRIGTMSDAYQQTGTFSYSGTANAPTSVYPTGKFVTGDPIYPSLVDNVTLRFKYRLISALPHGTTGTIEMRALVLSQTDTWKEASTVIPRTKFTGDTTSISVEFPLESLYTLIDSVTQESGATGANYSVDIQPVVHIKGTVGNQPVDEKFAPVLPFAVTQASVRVDATSAPPPPGATYEPAAAGSDLAAAVHPVQAGSIPHLGANDITIAKYHVPIPALRVLGIVMAVFALALALIHDRARRKSTKRSDEELTAKRLHALIVPVATLGSPEGQTAVPVPDFAHLAGLARFLERPILYQVANGRRIYAVDDENLRYYTLAVNRRAARPAADTGERRSEGAPDEQASAQPPPAGDPDPGGSSREPNPPAAGVEHVAVRSPPTRRMGDPRDCRVLPALGDHDAHVELHRHHLGAGEPGRSIAPRGADRAGDSDRLRVAPDAHHAADRFAQLSPTARRTCSSWGARATTRSPRPGASIASWVATATTGSTADPSDVCIVGPDANASYSGCTQKTQ